MSEEAKARLRELSERRRAGRKVLARMQPVDLFMAFDVLQDDPTQVPGYVWSAPDPNEFSFSSSRWPQVRDLARAIRCPDPLRAVLLERLPHLYVCQRWVDDTRQPPHWFRRALRTARSSLTFPVFRRAHLWPLLTLLSDLPQRHFHGLGDYHGYGFFPTDGDTVSMTFLIDYPEAT